MEKCKCGHDKTRHKRYMGDGEPFGCVECDCKGYLEEKIMVFDKPLVKRQSFQVSFPDQKGRVTVIRKEVVRQLHHMGCTDGLKEDYIGGDIDYEIFREVDLETRQKAIEEVEKEVSKIGKKEMNEI